MKKSEKIKIRKVTLQILYPRIEKQDLENSKIILWPFI